jgi:hypothetical protein
MGVHQLKIEIESAKLATGQEVIHVAYNGKVYPFAPLTSLSLGRVVEEHLLGTCPVTTYLAN